MVLADNALVKRDIVLNPEIEYHAQKIYPLHLKDVDETIDVLIEIVHDHGPNFEIYGKFDDEGRWYRVYLSTWKNGEDFARIKLTPWQKKDLTDNEITYIEYMEKNSD